MRQGGRKGYIFWGRFRKVRHTYTFSQGGTAKILKKHERKGQDAAPSKHERARNPEKREAALARKGVRSRLGKAPEGFGIKRSTLGRSRARGAFSR